MTEGRDGMGRHRRVKETFRRRYEAAYAAGPIHEGLAQRWHEIVELPLISSAVPSGLVLDAGCGDCTTTMLLHDRSRRLVGLDFSSMALEAARRSGGSPDPPRLVKGDVERLPFKRNSFDGMVCLGTLEYFADVEEVLAEMGRACKAGGRLVFNIRNRRRNSLVGGRGMEQGGASLGGTASHDAGDVRKAVKMAGGRDPRMLGYFAISPAGVARRIGILPDPLRHAGLAAFWLIERLVTFSGAGLSISRILLVSCTIGSQVDRREAGSVPVAEPIQAG